MCHSERSEESQMRSFGLRPQDDRLMKKLLSKNNLLILFGAIVLTLVLLLPRRFSSSCPLTTTDDSAIQKSCPFYIDQDADQVCDLIQGVAVPYEPSGFDFSHLKEFGVFVFLLGLAVFINWKGGKNLPSLRLLLLSLSLAYFGFLLRQALCPTATLQMVLVSRERAVLTFFIFLVFLLPLLTTLLFGSIFCHFLCPIGAVQEFIFKISRKFGQVPIIARFPKILFYLPYLVLFLVAFLSVRFSTTVFCKIDPLGALFGCNPANWKMPFLIAFLATSLFIFRPFCQFLCPLGAIFKFLEKFRILKPRK